MSKARTLADFISDGSEFADGTISVAEVSGAAPLASPSFTGSIVMDGTVTHDSSNGTQPFYITRSGATNQTGRLYTDDSTFVFDSIQDEASGAAFLFRSTNSSVTNQNVLEVNPAGVFVNQDGANQDFRVETSANTHALFVDAGANAVHINGSTDVDDHPLVVHAGTNANAIAIRGRSDDIGEISFFENDATTKLGSLQFRNNYARLDQRASGGRVRIQVGPGLNQIADFYETGPVFNESGSSNIDFRVESDSQSHALFVDASNNTVGVGTSSVSSTVAANFHGKGILFRNNVNGDNTNWTRLHNTASTDRSNLLIQPATGSVEITQGGGLTVANTAGYGTIFNTNGVDADFRVESNNVSYAFFVDAQEDKIGMGVSAPKEQLHIVYSRNNSSSITATGTSANVGGGLKIENTADSPGNFAGVFFRTGSADSKIVSLTEGSNIANMRFYVDIGGAKELLSLNNGTTIVNQDGIDQDFRVESENNTHMLYLNAEKDTVRLGNGGGNSAPLSFHKGKSSRYFGKFIDSTSVAAAKVADLMKIDSWQSGNSRLFGTVTFWSVNPIGDYANHGRASFFAKNTASGTGNTVTTFTELEEKGTMALPTLTWTGTGLRTLTFNMPAVAYHKYIVDLTFVTADGANTTLYDDAAVGVDP